MTTSQVNLALLDMTKKILVTGGPGFIGANLVRRLVRNGYKPFVLARKESNLWRIKDILTNVTILQSNLLDYATLEKDVRRIKPHIIFHLAAYGAYQGTQKDTAVMVATNVNGTVNLLTACCKHGFDYFVNTGSSSEYGLKKHSMNEHYLLEPTTLYGVTKAATTLASQVFAKQHSLPIVTIRPFTPYGYFEEGIRFIPSVIMNALQGNTLQLSNPRFVRDFIFIEDVIDAYMYFLNGKKYHGEIFNIGSGKQTSLREIVRIIELIIKKKLTVSWSEHQSNQPEPKIWQADIQKAKTMLQWKPKTTLEEGLLKTINWIKKNMRLYDAD